MKPSSRSSHRRADVTELADSGTPAAFQVHPFEGLSRHTLGREISAGVSLIAIAVPLNIGYSQIAGLPPTAGLYALVVPTIVYVLLVSSRQLVVSPDAAASALVFSSFVALGIPGVDPLVVAGAQAILVGVLLLAAGLLRWGFLANFLSHPILVGFVSGLAAEILLSQIAKILGITLPGEGGFFVELVALVIALPSTHLWSALIGGVSVLVLILGRQRWQRLPWALLVIVAATAASVSLHLPEKGVAVLGAVAAGPPQFAIPMLPGSTWLALLPSAVALAVVAMAEGLLLSRSYAERNGYRALPNQDLVAMGAANIAAGFSASYSVGASGSRTAAMDSAGSRSQLPSMVMAVGALALLLFGTGLLAPIPSPVIGAVVAVAVWGLLSVGDYRHLWRVSKSELVIAVVCAVSVLVIGPIGGIGIAFGLSVINLIRRAADPPIDILVGAATPHRSLIDGDQLGTQTAPGVIVMRFAAPLFFANGSRLVDFVKTAVAQAPDPVHAVVLDLEAVTDVDVSGAASLTALQRWARTRQITLVLSRVRADLEQRLTRLETAEGLTRYETNRAAVIDLVAATVNQEAPEVKQERHSDG